MAGRRTTVGGTYARTGLPSAQSTTSYDGANELTKWGTAMPTYDSNGNALSDGTNTFVWNGRNQLASMNMAAQSFQSDPLSRRVAKTILTTTTNYLYDGVNPVQELAGSTVTANLISGGVDEYFQRTDSAGARNFLTDALGSTLALTDSTGTVQTSYTFEPFGNTTITGSSTSTYQYTGRENDGTGMYFYRARYYNPTLQRFISEDPIGFRGGINLYSYAYVRPTVLNDRFGLWPNWTGQLGLSGSGTLGGWGLTGSLGLAIDGQGNAAWYWSLGPIASAGANASIGVDASVSNANNVCDLAGPFTNYSASAGDGVSGTFDAFAGPSADGPVTGVGVTGGLGLGGSVSESVTWTHIHTFGRYSLSSRSTSGCQ